SAFLLAPTSPTTGNLRKDGFRYVDTLQGFQKSAMLQDVARGQVIVVDESSMVSVPQMRWVFDYALRNGCRVILAGDSEQHHSVERGDAVRILEASLSVRSVELSTNYRAMPAYLKAAVKDLWEGRREEAWQKLDDHGDIQEVADIDELRARAVEEHLKARRAGETSLLACPIHAEAREITKVVLEAEKAEGLIAQENHQVTRIKKLPLDGPELKDPLQYQPGRVVAFHKRVKGGFKAGEKWRVIEPREDGAIQLQRANVTKAFDPASKGKWDLHEAAEMDLSVGAQIRINEGFKERGVAFENNEVLRVSAIAQDKITLEDGRSLRRDFLRIDQGVCITSYASQCRTVGQIVPVLPMRAFAQVNDETWYVLVSRAQHRLVAFTDCKEALHEQVMIDGDRKSVWEHERDEARRKEQERARTEGTPRPAGLPAGAIKRPAQPAPREENMREYERSLWKRAAAKYPVETRTPEVQEQLEQKIRKLVREHEGHKSARPTQAQKVHYPAPPPPEYVRKPERGHRMGR
ncbi:MAG: AAA family ATPase, partial [Verrucomicrobia bacterium]|nr:AAA family ATPase [Verrucomicrobiota bacterium]